jgi:tRNA dimethylallyltransferase
MPLVILGATASGKSNLAVEVARRIGGTVVNGDPFQSLAGLEIGTGQPSEAERAGVPHVGYGVFPPTHRPDPVSFGLSARGWLAAASNPVLVTGSGLYLRGIWNQLSDLPPVSAAIVDRVRVWSRQLGAPRLFRWLAAIDPARATQLHPNDGARIQRALALHLATGRRPSLLLDGIRTGVPEGWSALLVVPQREALRRRIEARVAAQIDTGWAEEVARLVQDGHQPDLEALRPLGYADWMLGGPQRKVQDRIVLATLAYAKRQGTFFRNQWPEIPAWDPDRDDLPQAFALLGV